ncbi:apical sushi protein, putative [Plasmodium relictum]|uniref:Apical sushi protein, putative n=1 Tax=Plasmodium relictum TaxID=85471 RepID=A0A1J1H543_PLARL|nr:apical sushi protein, putative [Plasmodium relictum]CRG98547.1 apical sushi protein, putative [Plasmodium relictum]
MNVICSIIIFLLYYNIIKASEKKYDNFLNAIKRLKENSNSLEELNLKKYEIRNQQRRVKIFDELSKSQSINNHPHFRSKFSFIQKNDNTEESKSTEKKNDEKDISKTEHELINIKSQLEAQEIMKRGEHFYLNGGSTKYEYNNDEDFFKIFHNNHDKNIEIYSPCSELLDVKACRENKACFYDSIYQMCFQNCKLLEERECLMYTECKFSNNGCENQGYIHLQIFDNDLGSEIRACELFETEGSCHLMEKHYKELGEENKSNFNCLWLSYKHEWRKYGEMHNDPNEENGFAKDINEHLRRNNEKKEKNDDINYNILSNGKPVEIAKNEKFLSLLELHLNEKKKDSSKNKNTKKKKDFDEDFDEDNEEEEEDEHDMNEKDHDNNNEEEEEYDEDNDDEDTNKKKNKKKSNNESKNRNSSDAKSDEHKENPENNTKKEKNFEKNEIDIPENNSINEKSKILMEANSENDSSENDNNNFGNDINDKNSKEGIDPLLNVRNNIDQKEKEISQHDFHRRKKNKKNEESIKVETRICANLNERPNPSILLEGALLAENEAELQKIKEKYNVTENEICIRPANEPYVSLIPDKKFYVIGEKIELKCQNGYKLIGTTNIAVCIGRNKIIPNITCESLKNFDDTEKENIQKINNIISSDTNYAFTKLTGFIILILNILYYL